jgi:hypothetical protein
MRIVLATFPSPSPSLSLSYLAHVCPCGRSPASAPTRGRNAGLPLPLLSSPSPSPIYKERPRGRRRASTPTRGCTRVRAYITPVRISFFCSFSPLPLVGVVGFAWQRLFRLAKGEGVTSILRGIPLRFLQSKNSRVVFILLVYSVIQVFM